MLLRAFFDFFLTYSFDFGSLQSSRSSLGTSCQAMALAWSVVCPPICPKDQAAEALTESGFSLFRAYLRGAIPLLAMTVIARDYQKAEIQPKVIIPGRTLFPLASVMQSTIATTPPVLQISLLSSAECFAIQRMHVAANFRTRRSGSFSLYKIFGKIQLCITISARSGLCLEMLARQEQTCLLSCASVWFMSCTRNGVAPQSTTL